LIDTNYQVTTPICNCKGSLGNKIIFVLKNYSQWEFTP